MNAQTIQARLQALGDAKRAEILRRFFKTGPGEYGAGDSFAGICVPQLRKLADECRELSLAETVKLLRSSLHESRVLALLILVRAYADGNVALKDKIYRLYLRNTRFINNWDLVDVSAHHILGPHLRCGSKAPLHALAASTMLWERRIAIIATFHYIKQGEFVETLKVAEALLNDPEDLIHKAVGWMLREIGKRDRMAEERFLATRYKSMPRTMLRYAIEKFPEKLRLRYLRGTI